MKLLRFFRFLVIIIFAFLLVEVIFFDAFTKPFQGWKHLRLALKGQIQDLSTYFSHTDAWNYIGLLIFISILCVLFVICNAIIKRYLFRSSKSRFKPFSLSWGGVLWGTHKLLTVALTLVFLIGLANMAIFVFSYSRIVSDINHFNKPQTALLFGTSKRLNKTGDTNQYYQQRIDAMVELYRSGKVNRIIVSGDNARDDYNEPANMMVDLVRRGVKEEIIELDFAGFRTLDSMVRLKWHFNVDKVILVSQKFHLERGVFLAWFYDVEATGFIADGNMSASMVQRELLAKPKALLDVFLLNMQPKFGRTPTRTQYDLTSKNGVLILAGVSLFLLASIGLFWYSLKH